MEKVNTNAPHYSYMITPRDQSVGGGWKLQLLEAGIEVGGGAFPATEEVTEDQAYFDASDEGEEWLLSKAQAHTLPGDPAPAITPNDQALTTSTGFRCSACHARADARHAAGCPEAGLARAATIAADMLAELDSTKVPLAVPAAIGVLRSALADQAVEAAGSAVQAADDLEKLVREYGNTPLLGDHRTRRVVMNDIRAEARRMFATHPAKPVLPAVGGALVAVKEEHPSKWYVAYCEVSEKLKAADACIERYKALAASTESAAAPADDQTQAARDVLAERRRQVEQEGWTPENDDQYDGGELSFAAACYATYGDCTGPERIPNDWPWDGGWWKPADDRRNLVKAGALILAEIDRLDRLNANKPSAAPATPNTEGSVK